jgi:aminoglycoside 3-N-acetyltransferase
MHAVEEIVQPPYLLGNPVEYRIILAPGLPAAMLAAQAGKEIKMRVRRHNFGSWAQRYDRLGPLLDEKGLKKGKVLEATVDLVDCEQMWERALTALKKEPFFFVEKR